MARTDHHRPYRVRVTDDTEDRVEHHDHIGKRRFCITHIEEIEERHRSVFPGLSYTYTRTKRHGYYHIYEPVCDIEAYDGTWRGGHSCHYSLLNERPYNHVPKDVTHSYWYGPERRRVRDSLHDLARTYNTHGEVDDADPPAAQHRHETSWWYY